MEMLGDKICGDLLWYNIERWSKVYFKYHSCCDSVDNNMDESFNSWILGARYKTIISMLEEIRIKAAAAPAATGGEKGSPAATAATVGVDRGKETSTCVVNKAIDRGKETGVAVIGRAGRGRGAGATVFCGAGRGRGVGSAIVGGTGRGRGTGVAVVGGVGRGRGIDAAVVGGAGRGRVAGAVVVGETGRGRGAGAVDCTGTSREDGVTGASKGRGIAYKRPRIVGMGVLYTESGFKFLNPGMPMNSTIVTENLEHHKLTSGVKWKGKKVVTQQGLEDIRAQKRMRTRNQNKTMGCSILVPDIVPSPIRDAETLRKSFKGHFLGLGTDEKAIVSVLGHRNASQRKKIKEAYQQLYDKSLIDDLHSELSGDFRKAVILWTYDPPERDARLVNEVLNSWMHDITRLQVMVEIACASTPDHLIAVRQAYCALFGCSLEEDIIAHASIPVQKVLISLVSSYRYNKQLVDHSIANLEASKLREATRTKQLDCDELVLILSTRNIHQLKATFECYKQNYGFSIDQDITNCGEGLLESILKVVIWCIDSPEKHFAEVIKGSTDGLGTDEDSLTRTIVTRAEIDMMKVKEEYVKMKNTTLEYAVADDTSGYYKEFLMTLLGASE
ncbi:Annexin D3 [Capsicum annuum]|nr:Annexin D3 [Capsicum annuum]